MPQAGIWGQGSVGRAWAAWAGWAVGQHGQVGSGAAWHRLARQGVGSRGRVQAGPRAVLRQQRWQQDIGQRACRPPWLCSHPELRGQGSGRPQGHCPARELLRGSALFGEAPCQGGVAVLCATHHCNTWQCSNCHLWRLCPIPGRSAGDLASQGEYSLSCSLAIQPSPLSCCVH